jgi:predicted RNA-binding protein with PUA-like domain
MATAKNYWLMKSEPECYSIADLEREKNAMWDGVRNYQVRNMMRDQMKVGDMALFYHSNAGKETGVVGEMEIVIAAYPDPTQFDPKSDHPDPKSDPDNPRWLCVDVAYKATLPRTVTLAEIKLDPQFADLPLIRKGNRLSIMPISWTHYKALVKIGRSI